MYSKIRGEGGYVSSIGGCIVVIIVVYLFKDLWGGVYVALLCTRHCKRGLDIYEDE
jgi:hypothetical protein